VTKAETFKRNLLFWLSLGLLVLLFLYGIRSVLLPFVLGMLTAYFLDPAADRLEKAGLSRGVSTLVITVGFFMGLVLIVLLIAPILAGQLSGLIATIPEYINWFEGNYREYSSRLLGNIPSLHDDAIQSTVANFSSMLLRFVESFISGIFTSSMSVVNFVSLIFITPVVAFYLLRDWDGIITRFNSYLPLDHAHTIHEQLNIIDRTLAGFVRGQLTVCMLLGGYYAIGLSLVGLKFGILIGLLTGLLIILPYIGAIFGMAVGLTLAFFQFPTMEPVGLVLGVFLTGQIIEGYFLTPKLVGQSVGLHPVWIIFGMLSGAALFGFVGVLLAVPVTAILGVLIRFAIDRYLQSSYYTGSQKRAAP